MKKAFKKPPLYKGKSKQEHTTFLAVMVKSYFCSSMQFRHWPFKGSTLVLWLYKGSVSKAFRASVGDEIREIVADWVKYLREEKLWGNDDPLFPMTKVALGPSRHFEAVGLDRKHWSSATAIRKIFRNAFESAGLPYFKPHSFRNTLALLGETKCQTPEAFKAWSQNLGHEKVLTTFYSYGEVGNQRQSEIIKGLAKPQPSHNQDVTQLAKAIAQEIRQSENPG